MPVVGQWLGHQVPSGGLSLLIGRKLARAFVFQPTFICNEDGVILHSISASAILFLTGVETQTGQGILLSSFETLLVLPTTYSLGLHFSICKLEL